MAFLRNPTFKLFWGDGKTPELQIKIIKLIMISGQSSKKKVTSMLNANNYPDISDAMDDLLSKGFIKLSCRIKTTGRNPERFYKITERGLRAILEVKLDQDEFWRAITLLCISSKKQVRESEFRNYYHKFESGFIGHFNVQGYFFLTPLFDIIVDQWLLQNHNDSHSISISQKIIECLAINGPSTIQNLAKETGTKEKDLVNDLKNYLVQNDDDNSQKSYLSTNTLSKSSIIYNIGKKKDLFNDFILHTLIVANETSDSGVVYELTLFGVMLVIAIISYHFTGMDTYRNPEDEVNNDSIEFTIRPKLFYDNRPHKKYYDAIVRKYKNKVPLVFGKWDFLKSTLGTMLYDGFDFLTHKSSRSDTVDSSIWSFGSKEFYDDIKALTRNAIEKLQPIYLAGVSVSSEYKKCQPWIANDSRMIPVYNKLRELREILKYADIAFIVQGLRSGNPLPDELKYKELYTTNDIKNIENIFRDEISFLFYMSLITIVLPASYKKKYPLRKVEDTERGFRLNIYPEDEEETREVFSLGTPRERLMTILAKDKEIKQWFSTWIDGIIKYRGKVLDKMSEFYNEIQADERVKQASIKHGKKDKIISYPEEYNVSKICSDFDFVYDY